MGVLDTGNGRKTTSNNTNEATSSTFFHKYYVLSDFILLDEMPFGNIYFASREQSICQYVANIPMIKRYALILFHKYFALSFLHTKLHQSSK